MNNLLKVSALFFAIGLTSCESKPATETTTTTETGTTETTAPATMDSTAAMPGDSSAMAVPATTESSTSTMSTTTQENK